MAKEGDIDVLLEALQRAGLIRQASPAGARHGDAAAASPPLEAATSPALKVTQPPSVLRDIVSSPASLEPPVARAIPQNDALPASPPPFMLAGANSMPVDAVPGPVSAAAAGSALVDDGFASFGSETAPAGLHPAGAGHYEVGKVISLMSDFVTQHLPERSLEVVLALESLASIGQVLSSLDDYRALITPMGDVAHHHLVELQRMLDAA
jgi:hypothetical protein